MLWLPLVAFAATSSLAQMPPKLTAAVQAYAEKAGVRQTVSVRHALTDLDGDGIDDALVMLRDPDWCQVGGCTLLVFRGDKSGYELVSNCRLVELPIRVSPDSVHGWKMLIVYAKGRGEVLMRSNGKRYPGDTTVLTRANAAQVRAAPAVIE
jgi:hypothetical protein